VGLIYLFRRLVFAQVLLGIVAFCMAERSPGAPGLLLVAGALAALSWYVVEGPTGKPVPQWVIIPGALAAVGYLMADLYWQHGHVILAMGHFTMWLQILLLYAKKSNREYGELLVLSLMQMIGASVLTVSMIFGVLLVAYCVLALFTLLLFQFKVTSDHVLEANQASAPPQVSLPRPKAVVGKGHRWQFRFTALFIGASCAAVAVAVFLSLPRSGESQMPASLANPMGRTKVPGFSATVSLDGAPINAGSREPVLYLSIHEGGQPVVGEDKSFLLRGAALDAYNSFTHTWTRTHASSHHDVEYDIPDDGVAFNLPPEGATIVTAQIAQRVMNHRTLFSLSECPLSEFVGQNIRSVYFNPVDQQIAMGENASGVVNYTVNGVRNPPPGYFGRYFDDLTSRTSRSVAARPGRAIRQSDFAKYATGWDLSSRRITEESQRILKAANVTRKPSGNDAQTDIRTADALAAYLRDTFTYELANPTTSQGQEPIYEFLFTHKKGHCELFASSLAAMARCIGLPARVITGYRASEFNRIGKYYVVRQSHAHAWTEIMCGNLGWIAFDATPPAAVAEEHRGAQGWFTIFREAYEHLEFKWVSSVVAYDGESRNQLVQDVNSQIRNIAGDRDSSVQKVLQTIVDLPNQWRLDSISYTMMGIIVFFIIVAIASLVHTLIVRRRRMMALQLTRLPRKQRNALARRLVWYLTMLDLLERHGYIRPLWQSPLDFSQELAEANPMRFDPVVSLTEIFYEIRFGHRDLDDDRHSRVKAHLRQLELALSRKGG